MKNLLNTIKKALKAFIDNYKNAMTLYGEAICRGRGCACAYPPPRRELEKWLRCTKLKHLL